MAAFASRPQTDYLRRSTISKSEPTHEKQHNEDDQNDADDADPAMSEAIAITAEATAEATKQEDDKNDDEY
jgi:hypothetical protein